MGLAPPRYPFLHLFKFDCPVVRHKDRGVFDDEAAGSPACARNLAGAGRAYTAVPLEWQRAACGRCGAVNGVHGCWRLVQAQHDNALHTHRVPDCVEETTALGRYAAHGYAGRRRRGGRICALLQHITSLQDVAAASARDTREPVELAPGIITRLVCVSVAVIQVEPARCPQSFPSRSWRGVHERRAKRNSEREWIPPSELCRPAHALTRRQDTTATAQERDLASQWRRYADLLAACSAVVDIVAKVVVVWLRFQEQNFERQQEKPRLSHPMSDTCKLTFSSAR